MHARGWAAQGRAAEDKLRKQEASDSARRILAMFDVGLAQALQWLHPFALNHSISFKVTSGTDCRRRNNEHQAVVERKSCNVRGHGVRAGGEMSLDRNRQLAAHFTVLRRLESESSSGSS